MLLKEMGGGRKIGKCVIHSLLKSIKIHQHNTIEKDWRNQYSTWGEISGVNNQIGLEFNQ